MKKARVTFLPIAGSGTLHLDFSPGPFGDATEALQGNGVGFFSAQDDLLGVTFDDVDEKRDHQVLEFTRHRIELKIRNGKITYQVEPLETPRRRRRVA